MLELSLSNPISILPHQHAIMLYFSFSILMILLTLVMIRLSTVSGFNSLRHKLLIDTNSQIPPITSDADRHAFIIHN